MADRGPNQNFWTVKAAPHQPLKGVFYTEVFTSKSDVFSCSSSSIPQLSIKLLLI